MATNASVSNGTQCLIKNPAGGSTYVQIPELKDASGLFSGAAPIIDATHLDSTAKEKLVGTTDEGSIKLTFNYIAGNGPQQALIDRRSGSVLASFQIILAAKVKKLLTFDAWVMSTEITLGVDKLFELSATLEVSGPVTMTNYVAP